MKLLLQFGLRLYQRFISPMLPHSCRFVPTCSEYAIVAIERYGALRGSLLAAGRLLRCQPFARAGYDPVPTNPVLEKRFIGDFLKLRKKAPREHFEGAQL